jgi:2-polyprenyl-3-methyl-5-hydroxy-6-metoxy-1,4-benzoquinol methylase
LNDTHRDEAKKIKDFYDKVYYKDTATRVVPNRHHRNLAGKLEVDSSIEVLDVACGTGAFLSACREKGAKIAGVDLSDVAINACHSNLPGGNFHACSAEQLPFEDDRFDLVTCLGSLEHFLDPIAALKEMVRVAKPSAKFVLLVPNKDFLTRRLGLYGGTYQTDAKEEVRTLDEWNTLFQNAGLVVSERWKDLHVLSWGWIARGKRYLYPIRAAQAMVLPLWPLAWQYQVYHLASAR